MDVHNITQTHPRSFIKNKLVWLLGMVIIIAAVSVGVYLVRLNNNPDYTYEYKQLNSYQLPAAKSHTGMSVSKPVDFILQSQPAPPSNAKILQQPVQARFIQQKKVDGKLVTIGQLALNSTPSGGGTEPVNLVFLNQVIADQASSGYSAAVSPMQNYVNTLLNPNFRQPLYKTTFEKAHPLKTANITTNAWSIDFKSTPADQANQQGLQQLQGTVVEVFGKNGTYYMALDAPSSNWQSNQSVWQTVINSLKVDQ